RPRPRLQARLQAAPASARSADTALRSTPARSPTCSNRRSRRSSSTLRTLAERGAEDECRQKLEIAVGERRRVARLEPVARAGEDLDAQQPGPDVPGHRGDALRRGRDPPGWREDREHRDRDALEG